VNALDIAESIAERLEREIPATGSFANGAAGYALFFLALAQARSTERWARAAHEALRIAATGGKATTSGLFTGLAGLLFVTTYASRIDARYAGLREQCAKALAASGAVNPPLHPAQRAKEYDLVGGVAGLHAALLYARCSDAARGTRAYLAWLLADEQRWSCAHEVDVERGAANDLGLAHGVAGMLSVLAADEDADTGALERVAEWLWNQRVPGTCWWPSAVGPFEALPARVAWCYGNPATATALLRVAERTHEAAIAERARAALMAVVEAPRESWGQIDYALCHGAAGNGLMLETAAGLLSDERIGACATGVIDGLLQTYDEKLRYGYQNWDNLRHCWVDDASLMTGAAGIGLALVTLAGNADASWTAAFGLPPLVRMTTGTAP